MRMVEIDAPSGTSRLGTPRSRALCVRFQQYAASVSEQEGAASSVMAAALGLCLQSGANGKRAPKADPRKGFPAYSLACEDWLYDNGWHTVDHLFTFGRQALELVNERAGDALMMQEVKAAEDFTDPETGTSTE